MTEHVLTTNNMGYFWCSCDPHVAHVLTSLNAHIADITAQPDTLGDGGGVDPIERDLWWGHLCPALANINALKEAQRDLVALGADWAEAGRILSRVQSFYVDAAHGAAKRYLEATQPSATSERGGRDE